MLSVRLTQSVPPAPTGQVALDKVSPHARSRLLSADPPAETAEQRDSLFRRVIVLDVGVLSEKARRVLVGRL